jgi:transcriptional regulator with XRE-family HTH domain
MEESEIIKNAMAAAPADSKIFISKLGDIADRVEQLLADKGWSQKDLAQAMGKQESEVSRWLTSIHNFTLKSISKMEAALGADILQIPLSGEVQSQTRYVYITAKAGSNNITAELFDETANAENPKPAVTKELTATSVNDPYWNVVLNNLVKEITPEEEYYTIAS